MFKAIISDIKLLQEPMSSIGELIDEGIFNITKEGISFLAADRAMVSVVDFNLSSSAFDEYEIDADQKLGLNIINLLSVLKRAGSGDTISFEAQDAKLQITIEGDSKRKFHVPILELRDDEIPPIDQLSFKSKIKLKTDVLKNGIADAEIIGDSVVITTDSEKFGMKADDNIKRTELEIRKGSEALIELEADGEQRSRYAIDYLNKMMKASKMNDFVTLQYGTDYPMKIDFSSGKKEDKVKLTYILAPRVQDS